LVPLLLLLPLPVLPLPETSPPLPELLQAEARASEKVATAAPRKTSRAQLGEECWMRLLNKRDSIADIAKNLRGKRLGRRLYDTPCDVGIEIAQLGYRRTHDPPPNSAAPG
jgi:hypothetical protein